MRYFRNMKLGPPTNSLERSLMILDLVARRPGGLTHAYIRRWFDLPTSTCSYILHRLEDRGYLRRDQETGRYEVGLKVLALARGAPRDTPLQPITGVVLRKLVDQTRLTAAVGVLRRGRVILVENVDTPEPLRVNLGIGAELAFDTTALGKVLIAAFSPGDLKKLIEQYGLSKSNSRILVSKSRLVQELENVRKQGYALNTSLVGVLSLAAPIVNVNGEVCAAVVVMGATTQSVWRSRHHLIARVKKAAQEISNRTRTVDWQRLF
jgi:IclR family KDG regulon transcriptional repressor